MLKVAVRTALITIDQALSSTHRKDENMATFIRFLAEMLSRIGASIFAGSLVSCLILGHADVLHIGLMIAGITLTGLGYPLALKPR